MHQIALTGLGYGCHGEPTSNVDRSPQSRDFAKKLLNRRLVGKIDAAEKPYLVMLSIRKSLRLAFVPPRHIAGRPGLNEGPYDGGAKCASPSCDDDLAIRIIHSRLPFVLIA